MFLSVRLVVFVGRLTVLVLPSTGCSGADDGSKIAITNLLLNGTTVEGGTAV